MVPREIEDHLLENGEDGFVYPYYEGYSLANVPYTAMGFLGASDKGRGLDKKLYANVDTDGIERVVVIVVDGLGYDMWSDSARSSGFAPMFGRKGSVVPITTVFPSTTAAAITTMHTGLTPQQHGLLEWTLYFEELGMVINTLPLIAIKKTGKVALSEKKINPRVLYRGSTIYQALKREGISSVTLNNRHLINTGYNKLMSAGSSTVGYTTPTDMIIRLRRVLGNPNGPQYINAYIELVDSITHVYGPYTEESREEISSFFGILERLLLKKIDKSTARKTLLIMTSDHGHIRSDPLKTLYLNNDRKLTGYYAYNKAMGFLPPTGSPRDVFLHIRKERLESARRHIDEKLGRIARIMDIDEVAKKGLFGIGRKHEELYKRAGDMIILPYDDKTVWYEHIKGVRSRHKGHHGGLSREEMIIPFAAAKLSELM